MTKKNQKDQFKKKPEGIQQGEFFFRGGTDKFEKKYFFNGCLSSGNDLGSSGGEKAYLFR